jgi:hypothetical protein
MPLLKKSSPEEIAAKEEAKRQAQAEKAERKRAQQIEQARQAFYGSPAGQARQAFQNGDHAFQFSIDVINQQAIIVAMVGSTTKQRTADPTAVVNSVCREGWELVNGDFVFVQTGQQSRDKFMSSGQNVAIAGTVVGYYLFRRCEEHAVGGETDAQLTQRLAAQVDAAH